ncbi:putative transcriptional regulator, ModE family [Alicycliphilus sp. B1]|nr:putative transcriptional regulator, ModE family [Alicycliphilus sp. B1]
MTVMKATLKAKTREDTMQFRVEVKHGIAIGPGKADILEGIKETGSLAETARRLGMSYQRVWMLVGAMNRDFVQPLVETQRGGATRGGASLTETGQQVLALYRETERLALKAVNKKLPELAALLKPAS